MEKDEESYVTFSYTPWFDEQEHIQGVLVLVIETTERKQVEKALRESENTVPRTGATSQ